MALGIIPRFFPETRAADILSAITERPGPGGWPAVIERLEHQIADVCGAKRTILMPSARAGLYWILKALKPPRLYLPAFLCSSVYECALRAGTPMTYLDCVSGTFDTRFEGVDFVPGSVVLLVHQYGIPSDPTDILAIARARGLVLVEDNAPSLGACWSGQPTGSFGAASIISFEYSKAISACKGGAAVFNDVALAESVAACIAASTGGGFWDTEGIWLREALTGIAYDISLLPSVYGSITLPLYRARHGAWIDRSKTIVMGGDYRADFGRRRALLASRMLRRLPVVAAGRRRVASIYTDALADVEGVILQSLTASIEPVYTHFPVLLPAGSREEIVRLLWANGIDPGFNFSYICGGPAAATAAPVADGYTRRIITLPISSRISDAEAGRIASVLRSAMRIVIGRSVG